MNDPVIHISGRVWKFGDNIDTDIVIATQHLTKPALEMKRYAFEVISEAIAGDIKSGDIIVAGKNFGCGSSRQQAVDVLMDLGIGAVISKSFARIFFRNSVNLGLPVIEVKETGKYQNGDQLSVKISREGITMSGDGHSMEAVPFPEFIMNKFIGKRISWE